MQSIREVAHLPLNWKQPSATTLGYELRTDEQVVATLEFPRFLRGVAIGKCADGCWHVKQLGWIRSILSIRACHSESEVGRFHSNRWSRGGSLDLAGKSYRLIGYEMQDARGNPLYRFSSAGGFFRVHAAVNVLAAGEPNLPLLLLIGWYYISFELRSDNVIV